MKSISPVALIVLAAALSTPPARAEVVEMLKSTEAAPASGALQVLPALSNPRPVRQIQRVTCNVQNTTQGSNLCLINFGPVPAGHVLQIDRIHCSGAAFPVVLFNTRLSNANPFLVAFLTKAYDAALSFTGAGPYYFKARERPRLAGNASSPTGEEVCSMFGTLWRAN